MKATGEASKQAGQGSPRWHGPGSSCETPAPRRPHRCRSRAARALAPAKSRTHQGPLKPGMGRLTPPLERELGGRGGLGGAVRGQAGGREQPSEFRSPGPHGSQRRDRTARPRGKQPLEMGPWRPD